VTPNIDVKTRALLSRFLSGFDPVVDLVKSPLENFTRIDLPLASSAEYFFRLWFFDGGEREISAVLTRKQTDDAYFWHRPFELAEFKSSEADLVDKFCRELEALLTHETRIVQRKGWLLWHFRCEYRAGNVWENVYNHAALRGPKWNLPHIDGRSRVYYSGLIADKLG
jgi:hypothetical protein